MSAAAPLAREPANRGAPRAPRVAATPARGSTRPVDPLAAAPLPDVALQRCACGGGCPSCAAAGGGGAGLRITTPDDPFEHEAERVADAVVSGGGPHAATRTALPSISRLQRAAEGAASAGTAPPAVHQVLRSPGQPLDAASRSFFERRLGHDFGDVRVHTDAAAAHSARAVQAAAYTVGRHVVFGEGQYAPASPEGRRLMAHELTHVVQQSSVRGMEGGLARAPSDAGPVLMRTPVFTSTIRACGSVIHSRDFSVTEGGITVTADAAWDRPAACPGSTYSMQLIKVNWYWNNNLDSCDFPTNGSRASRVWSGLAAGTYRLLIDSHTTNPHCCLIGNITVTQSSGLTGSCATP